jgi:hypothetical protein
MGLLIHILFGIELLLCSFTDLAQHGNNKTYSVVRLTSCGMARRNVKNYVKQNNKMNKKIQNDSLSTQ